MGLAASQARLLTITARLADNELRSQTINNAKMRLATQSAQASDEYIDALNGTRLMFTNTSADGLAQTQILTFNNLMQYSQYNNQYGLVNAAGQLLVSEEDARIFEKCGNNLETFLKEHDLEWSTTFFEDPNLINKLTSFYSSSTSDINQALANYFGGKTNADLKEMYLYSTSQKASIEKMNYENYSKNLYQEYLRLYDNTIPQFRRDIFGDSDAAAKEQDVINKFGEKGAAGGPAWWAKYELLQGLSIVPAIVNTRSTADGGTGGAAYALNNVKDYLNPGVYEQLEAWILSFCDQVYPGTGTPTASFMSGTGTVATTDSPKYPLYDKGTVIEYENDGVTPKKYQYSDGTTGTEKFKQISDDAISALGLEQGQVYKLKDVEIHINDWTIRPGVTNPTSASDFVKKSFITVNGHDFFVDNTRYTDGSQASIPAPISPATWSDPPTLNEIMDLLERIKVVKTDENDPGYEYCESYQIPKKFVPPNSEEKDYTGGNMWISNIYNPTNPQYTKEEMYRLFVSEYFKMILDTKGYFDPQAYAENNAGVPTLQNYITAKNLFLNEYGFIPDDIECLIDFNKMFVKNITSGNNAFANIVSIYAINKALDVLGEPNFAWIDKSDLSNTGNADSKAQWLTNIFNRMQYGYKVLENGLAKSADWLEYAFESGLVSMEQVDLSYNWIGLDYKSCANIYEETDNSKEAARAEAKYNRAMNDIKQKDSMYDLQLKNIDTEHNSLQTEYDVIKQVIKGNIERTMKFNQSA